MNINDMAIGAKICLGSYKEPFKFMRHDMTWTKVSRDNLFMLIEGEAPYMAMDGREPRSHNRNRQRRGCSFFSQTNLFQWLNGLGCGWFKAADLADAPPDYVMENGFLSGFADAERSAMEEQKITIRVPEGFIKEFGARVQVTCFVSLPSVSQICDKFREKFGCEGDLLPYFCGRDALFPLTMATRSALDGYILRTDSTMGVGLDAEAPCNRMKIHPIIRLKADAGVEDFGSAFILSARGGVEVSELEKIWFQ